MSIKAFLYWRRFVTNPQKREYKLLKEIYIPTEQLCIQYFNGIVIYSQDKMLGEYTLAGFYNEKFQPEDVQEIKLSKEFVNQCVEYITVRKKYYDLQEDLVNSNYTEMYLMTPEEEDKIKPPSIILHRPEKDSSPEYKRFNQK